jgi:cardiolipin synthase
MGLNLNKEARPMIFVWTIVLVIAVVALFLAFVLLDIYLGQRRLKKETEIHLSPVRLSDVNLFSDGRRFFDSLEKDITHAKDHIHISFFIYKNDQIGKEFCTLLINMAQKGVRVRLLLDALCVLTFPRKARKALADAGVSLAFSAKPYFPFFFYSLNRRNHRKLAIIDGKIAYVGGFNVGDEYLGRKADMGDWRDYHLRLEGGAVSDIQRQFLKDWETSTHEKVTGAAYYPDLPKGRYEMKLIGTNAYFLENLFIDHLERAKKRIFIGSPYFIPSKKLLNILIQKLDRGVEVTLLIPAKKDHPFVHPASYAYLRPLLEHGARVFHFYEGFYHAKVFLVDDESCYMGTANFDLRSFNWNDEMNVFIYSKPLIDEIEILTQKDLLKSMELTLDDVRRRPFIEKMKTRLSVVLSPFL